MEIQRVIDSHLKTNKLYRLYWYLSISFLFIITTFIILVFYFLMNYLDFIINFFNYFEKSEIISQSIKNIISLYGLKGLSIVFIWLFSYFYFFEYLRKKGVTIFAEESTNSKYFSFLSSLYAMFNYLPVYLLMGYLLIIKVALFELFIIIASLIATKLIFLNLMNICNKIVHDYKTLSDLNPLLINSELKTMNKMMKNNIENYVFKSIEGNFLQSVLESINIQALVTGMLWFIFNKISLILKAIFTLTFLVAFFGIIYGFNILSILYIELTLIMWYFIISCIQYIPKKTVNIKMNTGERFKDVFVIEDSSNERIVVLSQENNIIRIMKNSINTMKN